MHGGTLKGKIRGNLSKYEATTFSMATKTGKTAPVLQWSEINDLSSEWLLSKVTFIPPRINVSPARLVPPIRDIKAGPTIRNGEIVNCSTGNSW